MKKSHNKWGKGGNMKGIISRSKYVEEIKAALGEEPAFLKIGKFEEDEFKQYCFSVAQTTLDILVVDVGITDAESLLTGIKSIRTAKPSIRVVLLAIDRVPGDSTVAAIVSTGITDVIELSTEPIDEHGKERRNFTPIIERNLSKNTTYADVVRWHTPIDEGFATFEKQDVKTKIKKQVVEKKIVETVTEVVSVENKNIAICSLSEKSGSSFITMNLAMALSDYDLNVSVIEPPTNSYFFDTLSLDYHTKEEGDFVSIPHIINGSIPKEKVVENRAFDIHWNVADTRIGAIHEWGSNDILKQMYFLKTSLNVIDFGTLSISNTIEYLDYVFVVIDPQPMMIYKNIERLMDYLEMKEQGWPIYFVYNKMNKGVNKKELKDELKLPIAASISYVNPEVIYECLFNSKIPLEHKDIGEDFDMELAEIVDIIIGNQHGKRKKRKAGLLQKLFR